VCHARLNKKLVRVLIGFRLGLGVRDSVGGAVVVVRHDDVHDGMVVHSGPPVAEHCCGQVARLFPHLPHVLVVDQLVDDHTLLS
jgi:hypothetical protein